MRERQGEKELLILIIKKRDIPFHLSVEGVHLSIHGGQVLS